MTRLQTGSSISPQIRSASNVHAVFQALKFGTLVLRPPTQPLTNECFFLFFPSKIFFFEGGIQVLRDPKFPAKKKEVNSWVGAHRTRAISQGLISKKRRDHLDLSAENMGNLRSYVVITYFQNGINFGRKIWLDIGPAQSDLRIFAYFFLQTCLGST